MSKRISPVAAKRGERVAVKASARCTCKQDEQGYPAVSPTCPAHGHGRPAGTGK